MKLNYQETGEGQPLLILHGLFGSSDNWLSVAKELADEYKIFLVDLRNHGDSPHSEDFTYAAMADDLMEFVHDHQIKNPVVIGHSMGGKAAMRFSVEHPELVKKLVVVDIAPKYYPPHHQVILAGLKSVPVDEISSRKEADQALGNYVKELGVRQFLLKNLSRNPDGGYEWKMNLPVIDQKIENVGEALNPDTKFEKPTLFINGDSSNYIQKEDEELIYQIFPKATIQTIKGAGHWVHAEKTEAFVNLLKSFLQA